MPAPNLIARGVILKWLYDHEDELTDGFEHFLPVTVESEYTVSQINEAKERALNDIADDLVARLRRAL
jgi:hypothetical protein